MRGVDLLGMALALFAFGCSGCVRAPTLSPPTSVDLVYGTFEVPAANFTDFPYRLPVNATETKIAGSFSSKAGSELEVYVMDATAFQNFKHGVPDNHYYDSDHAPAGSFSVVLPDGPRTFHLVFDNNLDPDHAKDVTSHAWIEFRTEPPA